jgi:threonyl-tRNA synthetase
MDELHKQEENDHRKLGRELDLFVFSDLVGAGLPLWTPRGTLLRRELDRYVQEMRDAYGFKEVTIPHMTKKDLYEKSGHWTKFKDDLFHVKSREGHEFALKPMNCPHHAQIYASRPRSYKELPIRYRETTMNYRDEQTGELNGILRARSFTQDDAHIFCTEDDIVKEVLNLWDVVERFYKTLNFELSLRFSKRDPATPDAYAGTPELWERAETELEKAMERKGAKNEQEGLGDAAFYGPKLDFVAKDSLGREWQVATIQLDFAQPEGLGLTYTSQSGEEKRPVMIHCAVMGSIERFLGVYIEHVNGNFPLWLAPEQLRVATLNDDKTIAETANNLIDQAKAAGIRAELDDSNESVGKKIRDAELMRVPYTVVIGAKEVESAKLTPRSRSDIGSENETISTDDFLDNLSEAIKERK